MTPLDIYAAWWLALVLANTYLAEALLNVERCTTPCCGWCAWATLRERCARGRR